MEIQTLDIQGMTCASCVRAVERAVAKVPGVSEVAVNLATEKARIVFQNSADLTAVRQAVLDAGYQVATPESEKASTAPNYFFRFVLALVSAVPLMLLSMSPVLGFPLPPFLSSSPSLLVALELLLSVPAIVAGRQFYTVGFRSLVHLSPNMDSLVAVGTAAAFLSSAVTAVLIFTSGSGSTSHLVDHLYFDTGSTIIALILMGKSLEARAKGRSSAALRQLLSLAPPSAWLVEEGETRRVPVEELHLGDIVTVKPGEKIPLDGVIVQGSSAVEEALLTGESLPVEKSPGAFVYAGSLNTHGSFQFRVEKLSGETALAGIVRLVEEAQGAKAPIARLADTVSGYFVPVVFGIAVVTLLVWLVTGHSLAFALTSCVAVLVIACPCALGLATPTAIMVASGKGADLGIFFKNGEALETLNKVKTVLWDKTGTLTKGKPEVTSTWVAPGHELSTLLIDATSVEQNSEHPLAAALLTFAQSQGVAPQPVTNFLAVPGRGVQAQRDGVALLVGNEEFLRSQGIDLAQAPAETAGALYVARSGQLEGLLTVADSLRPTSVAAINALHAQGIHTVLVTGDSRTTALKVAQELAIQDVEAQVLPGEKAQVVKRHQGRGATVFVGDGINDAPALAQADVGIAVGAGADVAIESAGIVLVKADPRGVVDAIALSQRTLQIIKQNLFWAFGYNVVGIPIAAGVLTLWGGPSLNPMIAAFAMSLSSVSVVTNALRLKKFHSKFPQVAEKTLPLAEERKVTMKKIITVEGMTCGHCVARVTKALSGVAGLRGVQVELSGRAQAETDGQVDQTALDGLLKNAVEEAGYTVTQVQTLAN
ncbi:MAG: cadmium-translocating P-type ATPase [Spirochaetales bacterium]|nr:cadmium-translocating P-type ATPase [Spirochaetales bacterium]